MAFNACGWVDFFFVCGSGEFLKIDTYIIITV